MNIDLIAKVAGVLGLLISVCTFILTRIERRKRLEIELFMSSTFEFEDSEDSGAEDECVIKVRFTNIAPQPLILKPNTLVIECNGNTFRLDREECLGMEYFDELMPPTSCREIGIYAYFGDSEQRFRSYPITC